MAEQLNAVKDLRADRAGSECVIVLAPHGRDSAVVCKVLTSAGIDCDVATDAADLARQIAAGVGAVLVAEEALSLPEFFRVLDSLREQEPWSDLPVNVLASRHTNRRSAATRAVLDAMGNAILLERPLNAETLVSAARSALRSRRRQYEARHFLENERLAILEQQRLSEAETRALRDTAFARELLLEAERAAREAAERSSRMKDEFLATLSHELRTPLSAILGWTSLLRKPEVFARQGDRGLETIERNARAQVRLIDDMLDMRRIIAGEIDLEPVELSLPAEIRRVLENVQPDAAKKSLRIHYQYGPAVNDVIADPSRLRQIITNLISNAIKFTPDNGEITVQTIARDRMVGFTITDSGEGISAEFLPFVFDRFRQADGSTRRRHGGLGLGLAIVKQLVQLQGGTVSSHSDGPGKGAAFSVLLPAVQAVDSVATEASDRTTSALNDAEYSEAVLQGVRLLVVDDDVDGLEMLCQTLVAHSADIFSAPSAESALETLEHEAVDLVITDLGMPGMDGFDLLKALQSSYPDLPVIALTAFAREEDHSRSMAVGFKAHLTKPVRTNELLVTIQRLVS